MDKLSLAQIRNNVTFVGIDFGTKKDEQQIFDTINSLGVRLTTAELLKNYLFDRRNANDYLTYWYDIFEKDEQIKSLLGSTGNRWAQCSGKYSTCFCIHFC